MRVVAGAGRRGGRSQRPGDHQRRMQVTLAQLAARHRLLDGRRVEPLVASDPHRWLGRPRPASTCSCRCPAPARPLRALTTRASRASSLATRRPAASRRSATPHMCCAIRSGTHLADAGADVGAIRELAGHADNPHHNHHHHHHLHRRQRRPPRTRDRRAQPSAAAALLAPQPGRARNCRFRPVLTCRRPMAPRTPAAGNGARTTA
jgi:hypothetical protein